MAFVAVITCPDCGTEELSKSPNKVRCKACAKSRRRIKLKAYTDKSIKSGKRVGRRICRKCNVSKPHSAYSVIVVGRVTCDECKALPPAVSFAIPAEWRVEYQLATDPLGVEVQELAPSDCFTCKHLPHCRAIVQDIFSTLPCQREE